VNKSVFMAACALLSLFSPALDVWLPKPGKTGRQYSDRLTRLAKSREFFFHLKVWIGRRCCLKVESK